jgi:flagellar L-ring protein precursor FlgH
MRQNSCTFLAPLVTVVVAASASSAAQAQSGSIYARAQVQPQMTLANSSWFYYEPEPPRRLQKNDIITVVVKFDTRYLSEGDVQRRKQSNVDAVLADWLQLEGTSLKPAPQDDGDPRIKAQLNAQFRAENSIEARDSMQFTIAAKVADIRPNGNLVIEAHRIIRSNEEVWEQSLTGLVSPEHILPGNRVLSDSIAELTIHKREQGHVRDAVNRGWLLRFYDRVKPF